MRLKTIPRQRRPNYSHVTTTKDNGRVLRSTDTTQDVNEKSEDSHKHNRMVKCSKNLDGDKYETLRTAGQFNRQLHVAEKYNEKIGSAAESNILIMQENSEAVNLSMDNAGLKSGQKIDVVDECVALDYTMSGNNFAGTVLYQIMTDPTFVENIKNNKEMRMLTCKFCRQKFANHNKLLDHLDSRLDEFDRITCCACRKTFGQKRYLRYHQRCHVVNDKFSCEICMKTYSRMDNLSRHKTYHTNPDKYSCDICKKTFSRRDLMTKHAKSHEGKKANCDICKTVFIDLANLKAHTRFCTQKTKQTQSTFTEN